MAEDQTTDALAIQRMWLTDVDVTAISLVKQGANGRRIFLYKSAGAAEALPVSSRIVKAAGEWSAFYVVVAEPGREEEPGVAEGTDQTIRDVWADEDEIRKAAHRFMHNGALVNRMHEDLEPYGTLVENAIALADVEVGDEVIKKGSWYIAIEPTEEGRRAVDAGEFSGVSIQGSGLRTPADDLLGKPKIAKGTTAYMTDYDRDLILEMLTEPMAKAGSSASLPDLDWSAAQNWIDRLPAALGAAFKKSWIYRAAKHLTFEVYGGNRGHAFAVAINAARRGCATGDLNWPGAQSVNPGSRAEMCAAVAVWEQMKAAAHSSTLTKSAEEAIEKMDTVTQDKAGMWAKLGEFFGVTEAAGDSSSSELAKGTGTTSDMSETATTGTQKSVEDRVTDLEGKVDGISTSIEKLSGLPAAIEKLGERLPAAEAKAEEAPKAADLEKSLNDFVDTTNAAIEKMAGQIGQLAEGDSAQTGDELAKSAEDGAAGSSWQTEVLA